MVNDIRHKGRIHVLEVVGNAIVGGMERWVERLVQALPGDRFEVSVLLPCEGPFATRLRECGASVVVTPMPADPSWDSILLATSLVRHTGVDVLHAHLPNAHALAALAGRLAGRPVLTTIHGREPALLDLELHRLAGSHLSVVCRQTYYRALGLGAQPALLSHEPNGVDCEVFQPQPRPLGEGALRTRLGLAADVPLLGFAGRLSPEKAPEVFVRSIGPLLARCEAAHAVIAGEGPMRAAVQREIAQFRLQDRVHLLGLVNDMPRFYAEIDVLCSSSHSEAMPLNLMEAMACGVPVVATRVGGVPDIVAHGQDGWLVAPNDCDDIGARSAGLLADAALRRRFGACARERMRAGYSLAERHRQLQQLLVRLAGAGSGGSEALSLPLPGRRGSVAVVHSRAKEEASDAASGG